MSGDITVRQLAQLVCKALGQALHGRLGSVIRRVPTVIVEYEKHVNYTAGTWVTRALLTADS
jgi:hypothetical protein